MHTFHSACDTHCLYHEQVQIQNEKASYEDNSVDPVESIQSSGDIDEFVKVPSNAGDPAVWLPRSR